MLLGAAGRHNNRFEPTAFDRFAKLPASVLPKQHFAGGINNVPVSPSTCASVGPPAAAQTPRPTRNRLRDLELIYDLELTRAGMATLSVLRGPNAILSRFRYKSEADMGIIPTHEYEIQTPVRDGAGKGKEVRNEEPIFAFRDAVDGSGDSRGLWTGGNGFAPGNRSRSERRRHCRGQSRGGQYLNQCRGTNSNRHVRTFHICFTGPRRTIQAHG